MDDKFGGLLDSLPEKPPRSRLEPYSELIVELRRRGRTYREMARILAEKCKVHDGARRKKARTGGPATLGLWGWHMELSDTLPDQREVHVWFVELAASAASVEACFRSLSADERERASRFRFEHLKTAFTLSR